MTYGTLDDVLTTFDRLIELLQDACADADIITLVEDAKEVLEDRQADEAEED
jgi:hypothetical protein